MRFQTAKQAIETINTITELEEQNFETLIFADFNRYTTINTMITNTNERDFIKECEILNKKTNVQTTTAKMQNNKRSHQRNQTNPKLTHKHGS